MNFSKIEEIQEFNYSGKVYDLEVENSASYNIEGLTVHNSAGSSLIAYLIGITRVDPVLWDLNFARFMSPERADNGKRIKITFQNGEEKIMGEFDRVQIVRNGTQCTIKAKDILASDEFIA